jgi:hypothetical protein
MPRTSTMSSKIKWGLERIPDAETGSLPTDGQSDAARVTTAEAPQHHAQGGAFSL